MSNSRPPYMLRVVPWSFLLAICLLCYACRPSIPVGIMSEGKMEDVLYDYNLAIAMAEYAPVDSIDFNARRYQYVQLVFQKHSITEAEFDSSMVWYSSEGKRLTTIMQRISDRLDAEAKTLGVGVSETELYASYGFDGDTANVWNGPKILFLTNRQPDNVRIFSLPVDSTYLAGDSYKLSFNSNFLPRDGRHSVYALFCVCYSDSSVLSQVQCIGSDYKCTLNLQPNERQDTLLPQRISLTLYSPPQSRDNNTQIFCMTFPSVLRIHAPEKEPVDEVSLQADSLSLANDSIQADSVRAPAEVRRLTPLEERNMREERHEINIVKEKLSRPTRRPQTRRRVQ